MWATLALRFGRTIGELQTLMLQAEFEFWGEFYRLFPFDDVSLHARPASALASIWGGSKTAEEVLNYLDPSRRVAEDDDPAWAGFSEADRRTMRAFGVTPKMRST